MLLLFVVMLVVFVFIVFMVTFWCPQSLWLCVRVVWPNGGVSMMWFVWFLMLFLWLLLWLFVVVAMVLIMVNYCDFGGCGRLELWLLCGDFGCVKWCGCVVNVVDVVVSMWCDVLGMRKA